MQPVPQVTATDVERIVRRDFPTESYNAVMAALHQYGAEKWQREKHRVRLAVLKLSKGDQEELRRQIEVAKSDYRDVLAYAEYPSYMNEIPPGGGVSPDKRRQIIDQDWLQYKDWLNRK